MDDEGKWDKEQQHLDDHHYDLLHEERLENCDHDEWVVTEIINTRTHGLRGEKLDDPMLEVEIECEFCGKSNMGEIQLDFVLKWLNQHTTPYYYEEWE